MEAADGRGRTHNTVQAEQASGLPFPASLTVIISGPVRLVVSNVDRAGVLPLSDLSANAAAFSAYLFHVFLSRLESSRSCLL